MISREGKKRIIIAVVFSILFLIIGFYAGSYFTMKAVVSIGVGFLDMEIIEQALYQYKYNIKHCYPSIIENASYYRN